MLLPLAKRFSPFHV